MAQGLMRGPRLVVHRCNDVARATLALRLPWVHGIEVDAQLHGNKVALHHDADAPRVAAEEVLDVVRRSARRGRRIALLVEVKGPLDGAEAAQALLDAFVDLGPHVEVRFAGFRPDDMSRLADAGQQCYVFVQETGRQDRVAWRDQTRVDPRLGVHVRLHRFDAPPTWTQVVALGRPFMLSGWHVLRSGWPRRALDGVWNVRGLL